MVICEISRKIDLLFRDFTNQTAPFVDFTEFGGGLQSEDFQILFVNKFKKTLIKIFKLSVNVCYVYGRKKNNKQK